MGKVVYLNKGGNAMTREISIFDVASTFLSFEAMTHKKLQKLCYYAQAWHLALFNEPLFKNRFEAWIHGPVCRELYDVYKHFGWKLIEEPISGSFIKNDDIRKFLETIYNTYGEFDGDELEVLTHSEYPWQEARCGLEEWEPSTNYINEDIMRDYYCMVYEKGQND